MNISLLVYAMMLHIARIITHHWLKCHNSRPSVVRVPTQSELRTYRLNLIRLGPAQGTTTASHSSLARITIVCPSLWANMAPRCAVVAVSALVIAAPAAVLGSQPPECKRFDEIYASGKELCENMWNDAFTYEEDEAKAYTMWFYDAENPNDATSESLGLLTGDHEVCHLDYFHKDTPGPEPDGFSECHPWKDNACCSHDTVMSATTLKEAYGQEFHWDRCGPLSPECERFFVQEACFYECDPNAGLFRKWNSTEYDPRCDAYAEGYDEAFATAQGCDHNTWQMHKMPIKASYCDAWLTACAKDRFCATGGGDFFSCAAHYEASDASAAEIARLEADLEQSSGLGAGIVAVISALAVFAALGVSGACWLVHREKKGRPVFGELREPSVPAASDGTTIGNSA
ncbi:unnamed protein product [Prorocentrum cordatum]|uniref:Folate receptor-like domain-containing protein n=1 Tax=Prorocentrum cordatum TaxID=2364126 RepID=A0ABN9Y544_9DINO|nr:unnamed protein product [Polarella glacialis]CAK0906399.1 unnamed protein product [Polarella glacialis]